jgi:uncharacterized protein YdhG (YjbR/CyaY superfamily)
MNTQIATYIDSLPQDRRETIEQLRNLVLKNLPSGYEEALEWGMLCYQVPLSAYPDTYNKRPLVYAAIASQKNHIALYLNCAYASDELRAEFENRFAKSGKKLDMGKSCLRFKKLEDIDLDAVAWVIAATPMGNYITVAKAVRS